MRNAASGQSICPKDFQKRRAAGRGANGRCHAAHGQNLPCKGPHHILLLPRRGTRQRPASARFPPKRRATKAPLTLCHTLKIAPGTAAIG